MWNSVLILVAAGIVVCVSACFAAEAGLASGSFPENSVGVPAAAPAAAGPLEGVLDPDLYTLGPGDVLEIGFWGDVNRQEDLTVNPDGDILLRPVGPVRVAGSTLADARKRVREVLSEYYRPNILSLSLVSLRTFQVHVVGMVARPGAVAANGVTRVSQAIESADGILDGGSMRNIQIRRGGETLRADLVPYLNVGDNSLNPFLQDGDAIYVPPVFGWVVTYGSLGRPGRYEFVEGETLGEILNLAGGFRPEAYTDEIEVDRFEGTDLTRRMFIKSEPALFDDFKMEMGDRVFVRSIPNWHRDAKVEVTGEVKFPGTYVIEEGTETLSDLIAKAGGFTEEASLAEASLIRGSYSSETRAVDREMGAISGLKDTFDDEERDFIETFGREQKGRVAIDFEGIFLDGDSRNDPLLFAGDEIRVPRASNLIRVAGQVKNPGLVPVVPGWQYTNYIKQAGGFAPQADRGSTTLIRGGSGVRLDPWSEEVRPGDVLWVPERPEHDWWQITKDVLATTAQLATIWLVIDNARRN